VGASSLREIAAGMESHAARLYHVGARPVTRSTLVDDALKTFASALRTAESIEDAGRQANVLRGIAESQAQAGLVDDALKTAERIEDADTKALAFAAIAKSLAKAIAQ